MDQSLRHAGSASEASRLVDAGEHVPDTLKGSVVAIGNFDGLHRGHQAVMHRAQQVAEALCDAMDEHRPSAQLHADIPVVLLSFDPHPRTVLLPHAPHFELTPPPAKARICAAFGLSGLVLERFDRALASLSPEDFVVSVLAARLRPRAVVVGSDFRFGERRAGDVGTLSLLGRDYGFVVNGIDGFADEGGKVVSSSRIRSLLAEGDVVGAAGLLGYRWFIEGKVVHGEKRGRSLGFPTANIELSEGCRLRHGIYAVSVMIDGVVHQGAASYGRRPTFGDKPPLLEVHVLDYSGSLYDKTIDVAFHAFLRGEEKFANVEALIAQMHRDCDEARAVLAGARAISGLDLALGISLPAS